MIKWSEGLEDVYTKEMLCLDIRNMVKDIWRIFGDKVYWTQIQLMIMTKGDSFIHHGAPSLCKLQGDSTKAGATKSIQYILKMAGKSYQATTM